MCVTAQWQHDESVQLGGFRGGGGEGPHPVLIGVRRWEGGAASGSASLRGHRPGTKEPLGPVSDGVCERVRLAVMSHTKSVKNTVFSCVCACRSQIYKSLSAARQVEPE